jgi:hypothetical protein
MQPDPADRPHEMPGPDETPCQVCGELQPTALLPGHLAGHDRTHGQKASEGPHTATKAWGPGGPAGIEHK